MLKSAKFRRAIRDEQQILEEKAPKIGELPPDFTLSTPNRDETVTLSELVGKQPVALVFGSFT
jgi:hypothetical protein